MPLSKEMPSKWTNRMSPSIKTIAIVALLAFFAIVIYLLATHIAYLLTLTHSILIEIAEGWSGFGPEQLVTFKVINNGEMPVDNLKLKILSKYEIINYTKDFSTVPVETEVISSKIIEANTSKLVQGAGSFIQISEYVDETKPTGVDKYSAYAVYDQGSSKSDFIPVIHEIEKKILVLDKSIRISLLALGIAIFGAALILTLIKFFEYLKTFTDLAKRKI